MDFAVCPECGELAEVRSRAVLESTDGPVEHARILCVQRHWFFLAVASLERPLPAPVEARVPRSTKPA